jgi:hypothetical protein
MCVRRYSRAMHGLGERGLVAVVLGVYAARVDLRMI